MTVQVSPQALLLSLKNELEPIRTLKFQRDSIIANAKQLERTRDIQKQGLTGIHRDSIDAKFRGQLNALGHQANSLQKQIMDIIPTTSEFDAKQKQITLLENEIKNKDIIVNKSSPSIPSSSTRSSSMVIILAVLALFGVFIL